MTTTPRLSIEAECGRRGKPALVEGCIALLARRPVDDALVPYSAHDRFV
jgi:hypothetical protein